MNPSAAIFVGSDAVSASSGRRISGFDSDKGRRAGETSSYQASSFPTERKGVARTSSDMAGSLKGGLSSLLASPAVGNAGLARSTGSEHFHLGATLSSDQSSFDSTFHSRGSLQSLGGLSVTPRSVDKNPGSLAVFTTRMAAVSSSPGTFQSGFSPLSELSSSHPAQARARELRSGAHALLASTVHRSHSVLSSSLHDAVAAALPSERSGPVLLQSRPRKPGQLSTPFLRSVGFSLPGGFQHDGTPMTPVSSSNQLAEHYPAAGSREQDEAQVSAFPGAHGAYLNAIPSFSTLVEGGAAAETAVRKPLGTEALSSFQTSWLHSFPRPSAQTFRDASQDRGSALMEGRMGGLGDVLSQREDILRLVESANGLGPPSPPKQTKEAALLLRAQEEHPVFSDPVVKRAFEFASAAHAGQVRKNGDPIIKHCLETAVILAKVGGSPDVVAAGLLHDCLDDTPMTAQQLEASFGTAICDLVKGVSNLSSLSQRMRDAEGALSLAEHDRVQSSGMALSEDEVDRLRRMILSMGDVAVVLIKLADRLHNLRTIAALPLEKQRRVASETLEVFAPLANRLGIWSWKAEIEDICFRTLWQTEYRELRRAVEGSHGDEPVLSSIAKLHSALKEQGVEFVDLHGRNKNLYSIFSKMKNKGKTLAEVFDRRGIRLIVKEEHSCYEALEAVRRVWSHEMTPHFKDYIRDPKGNGYQSIHVVVEDEDGHPLEIQIRTEAMHHAAEYGVAAHWHYKERKGAEAEEDSEEDVAAARQRVEWLRYVLSWVAELTDVKLRLTEAHAPGCPSHRHAGASPGSAVGMLSPYRSPGSSPGSSFGPHQHSLCRFPEHAETCCFRAGAPTAADDNSPRPPVPESEPLLVVVVDKAKMSIRRLQSNRTRESFVHDYLADRGKLHLLHRASLLVNSELVAPSPHESFHIGDQLEVVIDESAQGVPPSPVSPSPAPAGFEELQFGLFGEDPAEMEGEAADVVPARFGRTGMDGVGAESGALGMPSDLEQLESGVLPGFAVPDDCSLALEFGRRKLAVAFGSTDNLLPELCSQNRGL